MADTIVVTSYDNEANGIDDLIEGHESWFSLPAEEREEILLQSGNNYCDGDLLEYAIYVITAYQPDNHFIIQISDSSDNFNNPSEIVNIDTSTSIIIKTALPDTLEFDKNYLLRIKSTNPETYSSIDTITLHNVHSSTFNIDTNELCSSDTLTIVYTGSGTTNSTYDWDFDNGTIISGSGQADYKICWNTSGIKEISLTVSENGCYSNTTVNEIIVNSIPSSTFSTDTNKLYILDTCVISYQGTGTSTASYNWDFNNGNVISGSGQGVYEINWNTEGTKTISLSVIENGCTSSLTFDTVQVLQPTSFDDFKIENINVYPNPANKILFIKANEKQIDYKLSILSLDGKVLIEKQKIKLSSEIDISYLKSGLYLLRLSNKEKSINMKFMKH
jgi:hypothetical protein